MNSTPFCIKTKKPQEKKSIWNGAYAYCGQLPLNINTGTAVPPVVNRFMPLEQRIALAKQEQSKETRIMCPHCQTRNLSYEKISDQHQLICECGLAGPRALSKTRAGTLFFKYYKKYDG